MGSKRVHDAGGDVVPEVKNPAGVNAPGAAGITTIGRFSGVTPGCAPTRVAP